MDFSIPLNNDWMHKLKQQNIVSQASSTQDTGAVQMQECLLLTQTRQVEDLQAEQTKGCENPEHSPQ